MAVVKNAYPPASLYNRLPFIHDMEHVAEAHADVLKHLRDLLDRHDLPASVNVKLIHIHFHLNKDEILAVRELNAPPQGKIPFLAPMTPGDADKVYGCNYIVDDSGDLQAFEYTTIAEGPDLAAYPAFVAEFCAAIVQHGLQHKFGLAINSGVAEHGSWMELDFPEKRATFLLPGHIDLPQSDSLVSRTTVTKFSSPKNDQNGQGRTHAHTEHHHRDGGKNIVEGVTTKNGLQLTGMPLEPGTAFHTVAAAISAAA